ncbi:MAG: hypothetical protein KC505_02095 [Myxococcales bacterium]|nr:hypothetical protein [Myxococcales bacterium]USN49991.1 MAG: hypothetical protein H6731_06870 [Myxococcales bacterium]
MKSHNFISTVPLDFELGTFLTVAIDDDHELLSQIDKKSTPILFFAGKENSQSMWHEDFFAQVVEKFVKAAHVLKERGMKRAVIAVHDDGLLMRILSPRFSDWSIEKRMEIVLEIFLKLSAIFEDVWVLLSVEEMIPGGMDAYDGIKIARALEKLGLKTLIVTSGTKDFLPLYQRKITKKKISQEKDFNSHEPSLSSALWVLQSCTVKVWAYCDLDDEKNALEIACNIGLVGIIRRS